jgi:hypothetical protein
MIIFRGFSKTEQKEVSVVSTPERERYIVGTLYAIFEPDTVIECRDYKTGYLFEELPLKDIFNEIKD